MDDRVYEFIRLLEIDIGFESDVYKSDIVIWIEC